MVFISTKRVIVIDLNSKQLAGRQPRGNLAYKMGTLPGVINIPLELFETMIDGADPFPRSMLLLCPAGEKTTKYAASRRRCSGVAQRRSPTIKNVGLQAS